MRFGLFYEHQLPRPWDEDAERRLMAEALDQIERADRLGFDCIWAVEHHFLEEYSHSSAPEVFLAAASQRTSRIRLGHGVVQMPPGFNHPARVAERIATLDLVSGGRVEFGTGESSAAAELGAFGVERARKREQWADAVDAVTRMFVEEPFAGWSSPWLRMPPRNVVPKPLQKPHPPLWVACSRRETIHLAARRGMGALSFSFAAPEEAERWVREYYEILGSEECRPAGFAVNPNVAVVLPMMCHRDEQVALDRGLDGARFFGQALAHYYGMSVHSPGRTELGTRNDGSSRQAGADTGGGAPVGVRVLQQATGSIRGAIGTPEQVNDLLERYEAAGVDQVIFLMQAGRNRHEHIVESLELFSREVMPRFVERRAAREADKEQRLSSSVTAALARREPPREAPPGYRVDESSDLARFRPAPSRAGTRPAGAAASARRRASRVIRSRGRAALRAAVHGRSDAQLERTFGHPAVQRATFLALAAAFRPAAAHAFSGVIACELTASTRPTRTWGLEMTGGRVSVVTEPVNPVVTLRIPVALFARAAAGEVGLARLAFSRQIQATGDLAILSRLGEMFGGRSPY